MDDNASAGGIITLITVFHVSGILFVAIGFGIDRITLIINALYATTPASQVRFDTVEFMIATFRIEPIILLIGVGINYFVNSLREYSGAVSLGTILGGAAEMIVLSILLIAFTLFGGGAIDQVVYFVSNYQITGDFLDLFSAVQYTGIVFYGFMLLINCALIIQFLILCVQTVDYSTTTNY